MLTVNSHNPVDIAYVDFSKAFDAVYHYLLTFAYSKQHCKNCLLITNNITKRQIKQK